MLNKYYELLSDLEHTADKIGYEIDRDEGYNDLWSILNEATDECRRLDDDEIEAVEMELERLDYVLYGRKVG